MDIVCERRNITDRILNVGIAQHQNIVGVAVEIQAVAPGFLLLCQTVDIPAEKENLIVVVIPSPVRREHIFVLPKVQI